MKTYILNNRGCEYLGGDTGEEVTAQQVKDIWVLVMGESVDDILVRATGLWLFRAGEENVLLAEPKAEAVKLSRNKLAVDIAGGLNTQTEEKP